MPRRTYFPWHYLILGLAAIGLVSQMIKSPTTLILIVVVIGVIYYFYKSPPRWLMRLGNPSYYQPPKPRKPVKKKRKKNPFHVINGNKK